MVGPAASLFPESRNPREVIKARIEAQYPLDPVRLHHGEVQRVARAQRIGKHDLLRALHLLEPNRKDLVKNAGKRFDCGRPARRIPATML